MQAYRGWPFLSDPGHPVLSAIWAIGAHAIISVLVVWPLIRRNPRRARLAVVAAVGGNAFDLDHAIEAGSVNPHALETLAHRPDTHALLFAAALALIALLISRRLYIAWSVFAVILAHLLWDAAGGGVRWLWPLTRPDSIPWLACPLGIVILYVISGAIARHRERPLLPDSHPVDEHLSGEVSRVVG